MKQIFGLIGSEAARNKAASIAQNEEFKCVSIEECVLSITCGSLTDTDDTLGNNFRKRGMKVHPHYWINMLLPNFVKNDDYVVIVDIFDEELIEDVIQPIYVAVEEDSLEGDLVISVDTPEKLQNILQQAKSTV